MKWASYVHVIASGALRAPPDCLRHGGRSPALASGAVGAERARAAEPASREPRQRRSTSFLTLEWASALAWLREISERLRASLAPRPRARDGKYRNMVNIQ